MLAKHHVIKRKMRVLDVKLFFQILYHKNRIVKIFLREHFAFCGAETAEGIIAGKAQIMTPETDGGRET